MGRSTRLVKRYSIESKKKIFAKGYGFLPFAKNMGKYLQKYKQKLKW